MNYYRITYCFEHTKSDPDYDEPAVQLWYENEYVKAMSEHGAKEAFRMKHDSNDQICTIDKISKLEYDLIIEESNTPFGA